MESIENVLFSNRLLNKMHPPFRFNREIKRAIIVANAYRQTRVWLTCKKIFPEVEFINSPPETTYAQEAALFRSKGKNYQETILGEIDKIVYYGKKGYITKIHIPDNIMSLYEELKKKM
jgi:uncharacterized SAM-binding protein YcdF (DUF218 family)